MTEKYQPTPDDNKKMEDLLNVARRIVEQPAGQASLEEARAAREKEDAMMLDETSDLLINIEKGTDLELYYKTLAEEMPGLGLSFEDNARDLKGRPIPGAVVIKAIPFKTDRDFIDDLRGNPVIMLLTNPSISAENKETLGKKLESMAVLPIGATARLLSREYEDRVKRFPDMKSVFDERYAKYLNDRPLSDEEMKAMLIKEIREEYENRD
jgi:hypothetical protein